MQFSCLNSSIASDALYPIELKLRFIIQNEFNTTRVFAMFDCCSTPLSNHKGIFEVVGRGDADGEFADPKDL